MSEKNGSTEPGTPESGSTDSSTKGGGTESVNTEPATHSEAPGDSDSKSAESAKEIEPSELDKARSQNSKTKGSKSKTKSSRKKSVEVESIDDKSEDKGKAREKSGLDKSAKSQSTGDKKTDSSDGDSAQSASTKSAKAEKGTESGSIETDTIACPVCETELRSWQINCHGCGQSISSFEIPIIQGDTPIEPDLMQAFQKWMRRGKLAFKNGSYDEAHACFAEALQRVHGLDTKKAEEIKARQKLADAFVKLHKTKEAVEQLVRAAQLSDDEEQKQTFETRIDYLNRKAEATQKDKVLFRHPRDTELMSAPLYCTQCHRLLSEREVYRFRSSKNSNAKCVCGFEGAPVTPESDSVPIEPLPLGPPLGIRKAKLIEAAQKPVQGGRDRKVAIWLAVILGNFGVHKFYLGEKAMGILYLALCWTAVPWLISLYEAIHIAQMSRVSFNLVYNIEEIVNRLPPDIEGEGDGDVFNMEISEDPEDLVDAWSAGDEVVTGAFEVPKQTERTT